MNSPQVPAPTSDDQLAERLARLQQRRQPTRPAAVSAGADGKRPSPARRSRRHPAAGARAAALLLTLATTGGLGALFARMNSAQAASQALDALPAPIPTSGAAAPAAATASPGNTTTAATPQAFNGPVIDTRYGPVQVQAQITDGTLSDVAVISYPHDDSKSRSINARALPQLRTGVLTAQQANVDTVSGATYTSTGYERSLQAAIDEARAAGATSIA